MNEAVVACTADSVEFLVQVRSEEGIVEAGLDDIFDFDRVRTAVSAIGSSLLEALRTLKPQEAQIEFSVGCDVKSGKLTAVLVEGESNASIKVTLKWKPE